MSRTVYPGKPPAEFVRPEPAQLEGIERYFTCIVTRRVK